LAGVIALNVRQEGFSGGEKCRRTFAQGLDHLLSTRLFRNGKVMDATTSAGMI
jgi:hypothetical protein